MIKNSTPKESLLIVFIHATTSEAQRDPLPVNVAGTIVEHDAARRFAVRSNLDHPRVQHFISIEFLLDTSTALDDRMDLYLKWTKTAEPSFRLNLQV